jgi:hypothetical protein
MGFGRACAAVGERISHADRLYFGSAETSGLGPSSPSDGLLTLSSLLRMHQPAAFVCLPRSISTDLSMLFSRRSVAAEWGRRISRGPSRLAVQERRGDPEAYAPCQFGSAKRRRLRGHSKDTRSFVRPLRSRNRLIQLAHPTGRQVSQLWSLNLMRFSPNVERQCSIFVEHIQTSATGHRLVPHSNLAKGHSPIVCSTWAGCDPVETAP